jgi:energy-coupling factor transporter ATP-binding protein EcfA2
MGPFETAYLSKVTADLTGMILRALGGRLKDTFSRSEKEKALGRCVQAGTIALLAQATTDKPEEVQLLADIFEHFAGDEDVGKELRDLLRGKLPDIQELEYLFKDAGYDPKTLPVLSFEDAIRSFEAAFLAAATTEPELQGIIQTNQLLEQTQLLREMAGRMGQLVELIRLAQPGTITIQTGKVLATIGGNQSQYLLDQGYLGAIGSETDEALFTYCRVLRDGIRDLPMRGIDIEASDPDSKQQRLDLARVYIDLNTKTKISAKGKWNKKRSSSSPDEEQETRPLSALEAAIQNKQMVLLGDPGSGKTTFINHLALCLAAHRLEPQGDWLARLSIWPEKEADLIPVPVTLRDFAQWSRTCSTKAEPCHLWDFIVNRLEAQNLKSVAAPLERALEEGRVIVLPDGLDEIPDKAKGAFVREAIRSFARRYPETRLIATCRVLSYQHEGYKLNEFPDFELAAFDEDMIKRFIKAWYAELVRLGTIKTDEAETLKRGLEDALERPDIRELASNPLLLTVMALVNTHKGRLPDARAKLYEEAVDILLWRWDQHKAIGGEKSLPRLRELLLEAGREDADLRIVLWRLAFLAQETGGAEKGDSRADIQEGQLRNALAELHPTQSLDWSRLMIDAIRLRSGLLLEREPGIYSFPHLSRVSRGILSFNTN